MAVKTSKSQSDIRGNGASHPENNRDSFAQGDFVRMRFLPEYTSFFVPFREQELRGKHEAKIAYLEGSFVSCSLSDYLLQDVKYFFTEPIEINDRNSSYSESKGIASFSRKTVASLTALVSRT